MFSSRNLTRLLIEALAGPDLKVVSTMSVGYGELLV